MRKAVQGRRITGGLARWRVSLSYELFCINQPSALVQAAVRLGSERNKVGNDKLESYKKEYKKTNVLKKVVRMAQKYFIESWLLPCSLRSHRIANPTTLTVVTRQ